MLIVKRLMTGRWPSTAKTCSHRHTNKSWSYDSCVLTDPPTLVWEFTSWCSCLPRILLNSVALKTSRLIFCAQWAIKLIHMQRQEMWSKFTNNSSLFFLHLASVGLVGLFAFSSVWWCYWSALLYIIYFTVLVLLCNQGPEHMPRMHCSLKAYCATLLKPLMFQTFPLSPPGVSTSTRCERSMQRKVELVGGNINQ